MAASLLYRFDRIAPNTTTSLFIHGYKSNDAATYSVVIYNLASQTNEFPQAHVTLTQGETFRWIVDNTIARKIYLTNHQLSTPVAVDVIEVKEAY